MKSKEATITLHDTKIDNNTPSLPNEEIKSQPDSFEIQPEKPIYQAFMLLKTMEDRYQGSVHIRGMLNCDGFKVVAPDTRFVNSFLYDLLFDYERDEETHVEVLLLVEMTHQDVNSFKETILGITANLEAFRQAGVESERICCVVVVDGLEQFLETYEKQKLIFEQFFNTEAIKEFFHVEDVMDCKIPDGAEDDDLAHTFIKHVSFDNSQHSLQLVLCIKQTKKLRLNTHLWFFGGWCQMLNPSYVIMLEIGVRPHPKALFYLYEALRLDENLAGCCGELKPVDESYWNLAVGAQCAEYKFSHIFLKSFESLIGYIPNMPSALSAYQ